ncbi:MAG: hypothetical protein E7223_05970 [Clostridiales bacterium]|nr:hypothetical protein [Clostridiales bacterium]MBQ3106987.1 hypothetical protein [Bacillota bacterium]
MNMTLTLQDVCLLILGAAVLVLLVYLIMLIANLIPSVKKLQKVLDDVSVITETAVDATNKAKVIVTDASSAVSNFSSNLKSNGSLGGTLTSLVAFIKGLKAMAGK